MTSTGLFFTLIPVGLLAGFVGALTGLGGGVILVPALTLLLHVDLHYALGASLVSVVATSSGAAAAYVREGFTNLRIGMLLEAATVTGAVTGAYLLRVIPSRLVAGIFGLTLLYSAYLSLRFRHGDGGDPAPSDPLARRLRLEGIYPTPEGARAYGVHRVIPGALLMGIAGLLSGLLGIGSGAVKVLAMDRIMGLPYKVSTATSNFMIGVTAVAGAGIYLKDGYIQPLLAFPVMVGVLIGALLGARVLEHAPVGSLQLVFVAVIGLLGLEMILRGMFGW
jgi:uncharacterized membrane protein YfcA